tara:strand:- start:6013 stop:6201 length:189 start_codon:yes stop_codon:yes gene_type:complete
MIVKKINTKEYVLIDNKDNNYYENIIYTKYGININNIYVEDIVKKIQDKIEILYSSPKRKIL